MKRLRRLVANSALSMGSGLLWPRDGILDVDNNGKQEPSQ